LNISGGVLLLSEQCRVKLTAGRVKSQGGVDGIADVITAVIDRKARYWSEIAIFGPVWGSPRNIAIRCHVVRKT